MLRKHVRVPERLDEVRLPVLRVQQEHRPDHAALRTSTHTRTNTHTSGDANGGTTDNRPTTPAHPPHTERERERGKRGERKREGRAASNAGSGTK